ncbi:unnamed protein product [Trifolium pratense]|uniref:Uncharacterized protein n=1 Tax=Trifolium pratense TaxID=57577 RepID=A0ACB0IZG5_TRIPR|nr:unnamed protein product [Trifolium pratense]
MKAHLEAQEDDIWKAIVEGPFVPMSVVNGVGTPKIQSSWDEDDKKKVLNDKKAINILQSALSMDEFFRISTYQTAKEKRFVHLTNHLKALGKTLTNDELNLKVLRSLTREWHPKVTAISEKKSLSTMTSATLFGKLQEYETELRRLEKHENQDKKSKGIALNIDSKEDGKEDNPEEDKDFMLLVKRAKGYVTYGDNNKGKILCIGKVGAPPFTSIEDVLYVEGLKYNLLSISQLCDKGFKIKFTKDECLIEDETNNVVKLIGKRINNIFMISLDDSSLKVKCLMANNNDSWLWHKRAAHIHMEHLNKLAKRDLVIGLPKIKFVKDKLCDACQKGKQTKSTFKPKNVVSTTRPLQLLHMDLFGPSRTRSFGGNVYALVIVDDFSRYTWTLFLVQKSDAFKAFKKFAKQIQNEKSLKITSIRSDHGGEFQNAFFEEFCEEHGIFLNFSAPRTPQQNGVVERKNRSLIELARTMLSDSNLPKYFWADAVSTACYVSNRVIIRPILKKTPYELFKGRKPNISHFHIFGCKCFVLNNDKDNLGKFDEKSDEGIFLGYSLTSKAYRIYNKRTLTIEESMHVSFDESNTSKEDIVVCDNDDILEMPSEEVAKDINMNQLEHQQDISQQDTNQSDLPKEWRTHKDHPIDNIIDQISIKRAL